MRPEIILLALYACFSTGSAWGKQAYPTNAVSFLNVADRRADWWKTHYNQSTSVPLTNCAILTAFEPHQFSAPCKRVLSPDLVFRDDEISLAQRDPAYARLRTSLFQQPIPFTPIFMTPDLASQQGGVQQYPMVHLTYLSKQMPFGQAAPGNGRALIHLFGALQIQWGLNLSYEDVNLNPALRAGFEYWLAAANEEQIVCTTSPSVCFAAIWVTSTGAAFEPQGFVRGVAFCSMDTKTSAFHKNCSLMVFEGSENRKYIKAMVGPPMGMGGGAFADDFGGFTISCQLPDNLKKEKLRSVKSAFGFEGTYNLEPTVDIEAETGFHYFADATKWGRMQISVSSRDIQNPVTSNQIVFKFRGRWWSANRDDQVRMPMFEDNDVIRFKQILEHVLSGDGTCNLLTRNTSPLISQR